MIFKLLILTLIFAYLIAWHEALLTPDLGKKKTHNLFRKIVRNVFLLCMLLIIATLYKLWQEDNARIYLACISYIAFFDIWFSGFYGFLVHRNFIFLGDTGYDKYVKRWFHGEWGYLAIRTAIFLIGLPLILRILQ